MSRAVKPAGRREPPVRPRALRGFEGIQHYFDKMTRVWTALIMPGEFYVSNSDEVISSVLGSCVSACIRDPQMGLGGMNHFMLPADPGQNSGGASARYGEYALERLINELIKHGADRSRFEIKVFGGGQILNGMGDIGAANIRFVREFMETEGLPIDAEDVGGRVARRVRYHPTTGKAMVKQLPVADSMVVRAAEEHHRRRVGEQASHPGS